MYVENKLCQSSFVEDGKYYYCHRIFAWRGCYKRQNKWFFFIFVAHLKVEGKKHVMKYIGFW